MSLIKQAVTVQVFLYLLIAGGGPVPCAAASYTIAGGPSGGTFQRYAEAVSDLADTPQISFGAKETLGSLQNIDLVGGNGDHCGLAYAFQVNQAVSATIGQHPTTYDNLRVLGAVYASTAQLVVMVESGIDSLDDLNAKKISFGAAGSGAAAYAELFFAEVGLLDDIVASYLGYSASAEALKNGEIDAFWVFSAYPAGVILSLAQTHSIRLLPLFQAADDAGFFESHPFFLRSDIPAGTYSGQTQAVPAFADMTLLIANRQIPDAVVRHLLGRIYSDAGRAYLIDNVNDTARDISLAGGLRGIVVANTEVNPLHPGARLFWEDAGRLIATAPYWPIVSGSVWVFDHELIVLGAGTAAFGDCQGRQLFMATGYCFGACGGHAYLHTGIEGHRLVGLHENGSTVDLSATPLRFLAARMAFDQPLVSTFPAGVLGNEEIAITATLLGREAVTVPAGVFNDCLVMEYRVADGPMSGYVEKAWLARNVGPVKLERVSETPVEHEGCLWTCGAFDPDSGSILDRTMALESVTGPFSFDIDGDGQLGLPEAIHTLKTVSGHP